MVAATGKVMMWAGAALSVVGAVTWAAGRLAVPDRGLSGDLLCQRGNTSVFVPVTTCVVLSLALTLLANVVGRWLGR